MSEKEHIGGRLPKEVVDYIDALGLGNRTYGLIRAIIGHATHLSPIEHQELAQRAVESCSIEEQPKRGRKEEC